MRSAPVHSAWRDATFWSATLFFCASRSCRTGAHSANPTAATLSTATNPSSTPVSGMRRVKIAHGASAARPISAPRDSVASVAPTSSTQQASHSTGGGFSSAAR